MDSLSIYIPAYNAAQFLEEVVSRIPSDLNIKAIHIINDGSQDQTQAIAEKLASQDPRITPHKFSQNSGYGAVVKYGIQQCLNSSTDWIFCLHGDAQYPPESLPEMLRLAQEQKLDLVQGSRHAQGGAIQGGMPYYKWLAGQVLVGFENFIFSEKMSDYHSGMLLYKSDLFNKINWTNLSPSFDIDLEIIASAISTQHSIGEVSIPTRYGDEESYLNPIHYGLRVLQVLWRFKRGRYRSID